MHKIASHLEAILRMIANPEIFSILQNKDSECKHFNGIISHDPIAGMIQIKDFKATENNGDPIVNRSQFNYREIAPYHYYIENTDSFFHNEYTLTSIAPVRYLLKDHCTHQEYGIVFFKERVIISFTSLHTDLRYIICVTFTTINQETVAMVKQEYQLGKNERRKIEQSYDIDPLIPIAVISRCHTKEQWNASKCEDLAIVAGKHRAYMQFNIGLQSFLLKMQRRQKGNWIIDAHNAANGEFLRTFSVSKQTPDIHEVLAHYPPVLIDDIEQAMVSRTGEQYNITHRNGNRTLMAVRNDSEVAFQVLI